jgi:hypothetical protein
VTIGLRKIAQHATGQWIESSASRPTSLQRESKRANSLCASAAALQHVIVDEPKAARQENSLACGQAVAGVFGFVAQNEFTVDQKSILDGPKRSADPWVLGRKKADHRYQQQTGIEPFGAARLHKLLRSRSFKNSLFGCVGNSGPSAGRTGLHDERACAVGRNIILYDRKGNKNIALPVFLAGKQSGLTR